MGTFAPISSFIGRQSEIKSLCRMLDSGARLITLTGPGGIGKTRLAIETIKQAAADFADGVFFAPLDSLAEAGQVLSKVANVLAVNESGKVPIIEDLSAALGEKHALLCIDNWEHVLEAAPQLAELLATCPGLHVLATSREALRLRGEQEFPVNPLDLPTPGENTQSPALQLFADRARAANPVFELDEENAPVAAAICSLLDGLPLAIELAAALLRLFSPQALLARLKRSPAMQLLGGGARDLPARQQTLRVAIEWSYNLLDADEQRVFRSMSVFSGGCDLDAAEAVCRAEGASSHPVLDLLIALADKNLLRAAQTNGEPRFSMLRTIQEYAREQLESCGELPEARHRHGAHYLGLVERAEKELFGPERGAWLERLDQEHDNLRAVLGWSLEQDQPIAAFQMGGVLWRFWFARGYNNEGREWLSRILLKDGDVPISLKANVLNGAGGLALIRGDYEVAHQYLSECLAARKMIADKPGMSSVYHNLGHLAIQQNDFETALSYIRESLALDQELGDQTGIASGLFSIGWILTLHKDYAAAEEHAKQGLVISQALGDQWQIALSNSLLGEIAYQQARYERAHQYLSASKAMFTEFGDLGQLSSVDQGLGLVALHQGNFETAESLFIDSLNRKQELGDKRGIAYALEGLAYVAAARSAMRKAARVWGAAETLRNSTGSPLPESEQADQEMYITSARAQLREKVFLAEKEAGAEMSLEQAIHYAQEPMEDVERGVTAKTRRGSLPAGLTGREAEVLRLVAQGLSDAEVAERLVLSTRTVNAHLTSIYNKLGVNSRVAATRFAVENGLV